MSFTETIYGIFFEPTVTLRTLADKKPYGGALLIFLGVTLLSILFEQAFKCTQIMNCWLVPANAF